MESPLPTVSHCLALHLLPSLAWRPWEALRAAQGFLWGPAGALRPAPVEGQGLKGRSSPWSLWL